MLARAKGNQLGVQLTLSDGGAVMHASVALSSFS